MKPSKDKFMISWSRRTALAGIAGLTALGAGRLEVFAEAAGSTSAHDFSFTSIDGDPLPLAGFDGKVMMVVNTASFCGFTHQYAGLQTLWERYRERGFVLLGVPSNDFGNQEPGSEAEIKTFCEVNFDIDFPMTEKQQVKGGGAHPFYSWASDTLGADQAPRWNFHKYLVDRSGRLDTAFGTSVSPDDPELIARIEALLAGDIG